MAKRGNARYLVSRPYTPEEVKRGNAWTGVPGARHIPDPKHPVFPRFTFIVSEWVAAGVEMTDEVMAAAAKLALYQMERAQQRAAAERQQERRHAAAAAAPAPAPGAFGDAVDGVVYYARRGQFVKIGTTTQLRNRMRDLMPDEVLAVEPGSYKLERTLHRRFTADRLAPDCEYFRLSRELADHIAQVVAHHGPPPAGLGQMKNFEQ